MFNTNNFDKAKEHFQKHRWCVIDNVLKQKYIKEIYKCVPTLNYGWWGCVVDDDAASDEMYALSIRDALPIFLGGKAEALWAPQCRGRANLAENGARGARTRDSADFTG